MLLDQTLAVRRRHADPSHRGSQVRVGQSIAEHLRGVPAAAVGVEDHPNSELAVASMTELGLITTLTDIIRRMRSRDTSGTLVPSR